jgi:hypothetical protein
MSPAYQHQQASPAGDFAKIKKTTANEQAGTE